MITRIHADNYRCLVNFTFEPKRMNLLVGDNGSGKTSLLRLLGALRAMARTSDALKYAFDGTLTRWENRAVQHIELTVTDSTGAPFQWVLDLAFDAKTGKTVIEHEQVYKNGTGIAVLEGSATSKKLYLRGSQVPLPYELDSSLISLRLEDPDLRAVHDLITDLTVLRLDLSAMTAVAERPAGLNVDGSNFPSNYLSVREKDFDGLKRLHDALRTVIGGFRSLDFETLGESRVLVVRLLAGPGKPDYTVGFNELSDGQRALVVLYHLVTTFDLRNRTLLIDEPDNFVSLRELQPWLQVLESVVEDQSAQGFIVSHHPEVIDYMAADSAWLFERADGGPVSVRPLPVDRTSGLKASEQLARGWQRGA